MKQRHSIKETTATNGPEGTVSHKIQVSLKLLEEGMRCLHNSIASINNDYLEDIELCTLLTIVVENLHAVSHFKDETFTALPYSQDFRIITNQVFYSWKTYYRVPHSTTEFASVNFIYATATFRGDQPRDWKCYERIGSGSVEEDSGGFSLPCFWRVPSSRREGEMN